MSTVSSSSSSSSSAGYGPGSWSGLSALIDKKEINFGRQSKDYAVHRPGPPKRFYEQLEFQMKRHFQLKDKEFQWSRFRILDLGTGPGLVAIELAKLGAQVVGVDIAQGQLEAARELAVNASLKNCVFELGRAEDTKQPTHSFDVVVAAQCWHWFDVKKTIPELKRIMKPNGLLAITQYCYMPLTCPVAGASEALVMKYNPKWTMYGFDGLFFKQIAEVVSGGMHLAEQTCFDYLEMFTHESWRGRMRTCNGVGSGHLTAEQVEQFDAELAALLVHKYPQQPMWLPHRSFSTFASFLPLTLKSNM